MDQEINALVNSSKRNNYHQNQPPNSNLQLENNYAQYEHHRDQHNSMLSPVTQQQNGGYSLQQNQLRGNNSSSNQIYRVNSGGRHNQQNYISVERVNENIPNSNIISNGIEEIAGNYPILTSTEREVLTLRKDI